MNKHTIYNYKFKREIQLSAEKQNMNLSSSRTETFPKSQLSCSAKIKIFLKEYKNPLIILGIIIGICVITLSIVIPLSLKQEKEEEAARKTLLSPAFKINTKVGTLTQFSYKSTQNYETTTEGEKTPYIILTKALFELYTLTSISPPNEDKRYYQKKFNTTIALNSFCRKLSLTTDDDDCELKSIFDLNKREEKNLRRNEENEDLIQKAILPICVIEHTDTNLIISLTCPANFSMSFKNDIIQAFQNIKPNSTMAIMSNNNVDILDKKREGKIYIDISNSECTDSKSKDCFSAKNITTDQEGNLLSTNRKTSKDININNNSYFSENSYYDFQKIPEENATNYNPQIYRKNLNIFLSKTLSLMKKEILIDNFTDYYLNIKQKQAKDKETNDIRNLEYQQILEVQEENIFSKTVFDIPIELKIKNDIGLGQGESSKTYSIYNINNDYFNQLSFNQRQLNLNQTFQEFISVTKSGNKLASLLNNELNMPLKQLKNIINENIERINNFLSNKDLSQIFDSTYALKEIDSLPYDFIPIVENLSNVMDELDNNINVVMNDTMITLNDDIYRFLKDSHSLLFQIFDNLTELTNILYSNESRIVDISSYYLNNESNSYCEFVKKYKNVFDNYFKREIESTLPLVNNVFNNFYIKTTDFIQRISYKFDNISEKISNQSLMIISSEPEDYSKILNHIQNIKNKGKEIIVKIEKKFKETINLQENGYFDNQKEIDKNIQSFDNMTSKAFKIIDFIDNKKFIDATFDNLMINIKDNLLSLLKYNENSLKEKFPLEENVLAASYFNNSYLKQIDETFKSEKGNILIFISQENEVYLKSMEDIFHSFEDNNGTNFIENLGKILNDFSELVLDNLNKTYYEDLSPFFQSINEIIEYNQNLGNNYLNNVKNANSYHITQGFINKYNAYMNSIQKITNIINNDLKTNLENKYYNVLNEINTLFQNIESTNDDIFKKYSKQLSAYSENYLNSVKILFHRLNKYMSKEIYDKIFLPPINNFISSAGKNIKNIKNNFENIYNNISKKSKSSSTYDYDKQHTHGGDSYCCKRFLGICTRHCTNPVTYSYEGKNVDGTNNHLNLKEIQFSNYFKNFDGNYTELYIKISNDISSYNSYLPYLVSKIENNKTQILKEFGSNYMNGIQSNIKNIIEEKLSNNLLQVSYTFYESEIKKFLPKELNNILEQWILKYEDICKNITDNKKKFKTSINEIYLTALSFVDIYNKNISYSYISSIIDKLKNEFNYTNKYYYDLINTKVNKLCSYVLNNLPINEKPLDEILNIRINEINISCNNMLSQIQNSKKEILNIKNQETLLNITSKHFFDIDDIYSEHINSFNSQLNGKLDKIKSIIDEINNKNNIPKELQIAKFYLENNINKKHINDIYDMINNPNFIDLQNDVYHNMLSTIYKNEKDELIKGIKTSIIELNNNTKNNFDIELEKYKKIIQDRIYQKFGTEEKLEEKISDMFSNGLINLNENDKKKIFGNLDSILNKIKFHLTNEANRLSNEMTSYSNNYNYIKNRLDKYQVSIYEKFYSVLNSEVNDFHSKITEKFYKNFVEKGLNELQGYFNKEELGEAKFFNISINLDEIMNKEINIFITNYKNITLAQIENLYQKRLNYLEELFSFSNIKSKLTQEIDAYYKSILLPILKREAIYEYEDDGISYYDLSTSIINDIDKFIEEEIGKVKQILKKMEGKDYEINETFIANFSNAKVDVIDNIKIHFKNFSDAQSKKENETFELKMGNAILDNFEIVLNDCLYFSVDFFDRILKYNEIQKINVLYEDLKYSLYQTLNYYLMLSETNDELNLPLNIKEGILSLNNIESFIQTKSNEILSILNSKFAQNFEEEKTYIIRRYIEDINLGLTKETNFSQNILEIIKQKFNQNINKIEIKYTEQMEKSIKFSFIEGYKDALNRNNENMNYIISNYKNQLNEKLNNLFSFDSDSLFTHTQNKFNETNLLMEKYESHLAIFKITDEVKHFLEVELSNDIIISKFNDVNNFLNIKSAKYVINNIDLLSNEYKNNYSIEKFQDLINITNSNFTSYINKFTYCLNNYGITKEAYESNLNEEINTYNNLKNEDEKKSYNKNFEESFKELKIISHITKEFIKNMSLFEQFEEKINNNINEKNKQYDYSKYILSLTKNNNNSNYDSMLERLNQLNNISLEYYSKANDVYLSMKEQIINNIIEIDNLINSCENITKEIINANYLAIKNKTKFINITETITKDTITIPEYTYPDLDNIFGINQDINNYIINNEFTLDIIHDENTITPLIIGTLVNNICPKSFNLDIYSSNGPIGKIGRKINVLFNNIFSNIKIIFDGKLNNATIITNFNFEAYSIKTQYYEEKITTFEKVILGIYFVFPDKKSIENVETPYNEKYCEIPSKNKTLIEKIQY